MNKWNKCYKFPVCFMYASHQSLMITRRTIRLIFKFKTILNSFACVIHAKIFLPKIRYCESKFISKTWIHFYTKINKCGGMFSFISLPVSCFSCLYAYFKITRKHITCCAQKYRYTYVLSCSMYLNISIVLLMLQFGSLSNHDASKCNLMFQSEVVINLNKFVYLLLILFLI